MENTLTAKEYISKNLPDYWEGGKAQYTQEDVERAMIDFAEFHVKRVLTEASLKITYGSSDKIR